MNKKRLISPALLFVILAALIGGSIPVVAKYALEVFKPFTVVAIRFLFSSLFLLPLVWRNKELSWAKFRELLPVALIGSLNPILLFIALQFTQASFSSLIYAGVPAMTAIYMTVVKKNEIEMKKIVGIGMGLVGVSLIVLLPLFESQIANIGIIGNLLIFGASVAFLIYGLLSKSKQKDWQVSPLALTFYFSLVTFLISLPFVGYEFAKFGVPLEFNVIHLASGVYVGLIGTGVFYLAYQYALKHGSAITASLFTYLQPISGILLAAIILGEKITLPFIIGGLLAVIGAQIASQNNKT